MNTPIIRRFRFAIVILAVGVILVTACGPAAPTQSPPTLTPADTPAPAATATAVPTLAPTPTMGPVDVVKAYEDAFERDNVPGMMALLTDDISLLLPSDGFEALTRQEVQNAHEYLSGLNGEVHFTNCQASVYNANLIICTESYAEDCTRSFGINTIPGKASFKINKDKIQRITWDHTSDEAKQFREDWSKFLSWYDKTYPIDLATRDAGDTWLTRETGTILSGRCKEYAASTTFTSTPTLSPVGLVKAYEDAFNRHDVPGVMALLTEDSVFFPDPKGEPEADSAIKNLHEFFFGLNVETHFTDCQVSGNTVTCKQAYTEDCARSFGIDNIPSKAFFTINKDKIQKIIWDHTSDEINRYWAEAEKVRSWMQKTYPSEWAKVNEDFMTGENATIFSQRCKEYEATHK